jgi:hypothetical protein
MDDPTNVLTLRYTPVAALRLLIQPPPLPPVLQIATPGRIFNVPGARLGGLCRAWACQNVKPSPHCGLEPDPGWFGLV